MTGADLIATERRRQIDAEGYDATHDEGHADELAHAGAAYALADEWTGPWTQAAPPQWPWSPVYWKPTPGDRIRELVKAGALIAAAIDSLLPPQTREAEGAAHQDRPLTWHEDDLRERVLQQFKIASVMFGDLPKEREQHLALADEALAEYAASRGLTLTRTPEAQRDAEPPWIGLAKIIREVDGNHDLGAGELAERIVAHPDFAGQRDAGNRGIDAAWAEVEAALPEGVELMLSMDVLAPPERRYEAEACGRILTEGPTVKDWTFTADFQALAAYGPTPVAALDAIAAQLAATQPPAAGTEGTE